MSKIRRIFPGGNTSQGFYSLHNNIIGENRRQLYILKGMPGGGKSSLMKEIGRRALDEGFTLEYHHCPSDPNSIDGIVIIELGIAIVDGTPPHSIDPVYPGLGDTIVNLANHINQEKIAGYKEEITRAKASNKKAYRRAFNYFKAARIVYDEIVESRVDYMDFKGVNRMTRKYLEEVLSLNIREVENKEYKFKTRQMFSNAHTPKGYFDYTETIVAGRLNKYYLKGGLGTGKSTFLKRLIDLGRMEGFHLEIYYNSFAPDKVESLIIEELDLIISSNEKVRLDQYKTIDFDQYFHKTKVDKDDYEVFEGLMKKGTEGLNMAEKNHFIQEEIYNKSIDFKGIDKEREKIWDQIELQFF